MSNKYLKIYNSLIHKRKNIEILHKSKNKLGEYENHHIIPRACGGLDYKNNIVCLTIREHYIAHLLLAMIYKNTQYEDAMCHAISLMKYGPNTSKRKGNFKFNSKLYAKIVSKGRKLLALKRPSYKGFVNITNGIDNKFIPPEKLNLFLSLGWWRGQTQKCSEESKKRKGLRFKNTFFVTDGINNLRILKGQNIPNGYHKGRTFKCHLKNNSYVKNKKWMYKDNIEKHVSIQDIEKYIDQGYKIGRIKTLNFNTCSGRIFINNGIKNMLIYPKDLQTWKSNGWKQGLLRKKKKILMMKQR